VPKRKQIINTLLVLLSSTFATLEASPNEQGKCTPETSNKRANSQTKETHLFLASLSCDIKAGVLSGQNAGHGDQISDPENPMGYASTFSRLDKTVGRLPYVIGLDYEHDKIYTLDELKKANEVLIQHTQRGGLVTINWSPLSPWINDERNLSSNSGNWQDTRTQTHEKLNQEINLWKLLDPADPLNTIWLKKLDRIAQALEHLQDNKVTVLWRPMQEMNGNWFWWGMSDPMSDASAYIALWQHMHEYLSQQKNSTICSGFTHPTNLSN
jgi:mannan endo-1,4-beta-mannosidase